MAKVIKFSNCNFNEETQTFEGMPEGTKFVLNVCYAFKSFEELQKTLCRIEGYASQYEALEKAKKEWEEELKNNKDIHFKTFGKITVEEYKKDENNSLE